MKKVFLLTILSFTFLFGLGLNASAVERGHVKYHQSGLLASSKLDSTVIEVLDKGTQLKILDRKNDFFQVVSPSGQSGWVHSRIINPLPAMVFHNTCGSNLNIRRSPTTSSLIIGQMPPDAVADYVDTYHSWHIVTYNGIQGYVASWYGDVKLPKGNHLVVEEAVVNLRESPSLTSSVIGLSYSGDVLPVHSYKNGWFGILSNQQNAYIAGWLTSFDSSFNDLGTEPFKHTTDNLRLRSSPSLNGTIMQILPTGTPVQVLAVVDDWNLVLAPNGQLGFSHMDYLKSFNPLHDSTIVLDPGHGGRDPGAIGPSGIFEKTVNLSVALKVQSLLESNGAHVILTRSTDTYLSNSERADIATDYQADILVSIHHNALNDRNYFGMSTYYDTRNNRSGAESSRLAHKIYSSIVMNHSVYGDGTHNRNFEVLRSTHVPAALIEIGFISNPWEETNISNHSYQEAIAQNIVDGILDYFFFKP